MTEPAIITADEAVAALTSAAWTESTPAEAYEKAVAAVREMAERAHDQHRGLAPIDVLAAIDRKIRTPRTGIHCFLGGFGADWDLDEAVKFVRSAEKVGWVPNILRHELAAFKDGKLYAFEVRAPQTDGDQR